VRDPRDVCLSYFTFLQRVERLVIRPGDDVAASFDRFVDAFLAGRLDAHGTWQSHLLSWLGAAQEGRAAVLRVRFEDLRADPAGQVERIAEWLGISLASGAAAGVAARCSIERMREAEAYAAAHTPEALPAVALRTGLPNVSSGRVGGWRSRLTRDQAARFGAVAGGLALMGYDRP
jgi:hypothetical protein